MPTISRFASVLIQNKNFDLQAKYALFFGLLGPFRLKTTMPSASTKTTPIDLALQGGGSHGAYTWGVLDRLLDEPWLTFAGVSGTSAGAMNAVALAAGLMEGGRRGAQASLRRLWMAVGHLGDTVTPPDWVKPWMWPLATPQWPAVSPYQSNPLNINPLRHILLDNIDFDRVRQCHKTRLYIAATEVNTGRLQLFDRASLTVDHILASACLPMLFQAIEIDGQRYWDGGYAGNPSLMPLIAETEADDLLLVQINPSVRESKPVTSADISDRINEITFNASLLKELRTLAWMRRLMEEESHKGGCQQLSPAFERVRDLRLHRLDATADLAPLGAQSKLRTDGRFLQQLFASGQQAADQWLQTHASDIGHRSTVQWGELL
jgi:NTE family protein